MGELVAWVVGVVGIILVGYYLLRGAGWVLTHETGWCVLAVVIVVAVLVLWLCVRYLVRSATRGADRREAEERVEAGVARARRERDLIARRARGLEEQSATLDRVTDELGFAVLVATHHESRLIADAWYRQKHLALDARRELTGLARSVRGMAGSTGARRSALASLGSAVAALNKEIGRGDAALTRHNGRTRALKLRIRDTCGPRGARWYDELEQRTLTRRNGAG